MIAAASACYLYFANGVALWPAFWKSTVYLGGAFAWLSISTHLTNTKMLMLRWVGVILFIGLFFFLYKGWRWVYMGQPLL